MEDSERKERIRKLFRDKGEREFTEEELQEAQELAREMAKKASQYMRGLAREHSNKRYRTH